MLVVASMVGCGAPQQEAAEVKMQGSESYLNQGVRYLKEANVTEAIKNFDEAIKQDPLDTRGYMILGQTYMRLNDSSRAVDTFSAAARVAPNSGEIQYLLAVNYGLMGEMDLARQSAQKSVEIFKALQNDEDFAKSLSLLQGLMTTEDAPEEAAQQAPPESAKVE